MSAAFKRGKNRNISIYVGFRRGFAQRSTGTSDPAIARKMKRAMRELRDDREFDVLEAIRLKRAGFSVAEVYEAVAGKRIDGLKATLADVALADHLDGWGDWVVAQTGVERTAAHYRQQVETLVTGKLQRSELTSPKVSTWLAGLAVSPGTRRKYLYALRSFVAYLVERGLITADPTLGVKRPKKNPARLRWEPLETAQAIVQAQPEPFRTLAALREGAAVEISAALAMRRRDVDLSRMVAHIPGTKTIDRDRHEIIVEQWAWPYLARHCKALERNDLLFPEIDRYAAYDQHIAACATAKVTDYTMHDCRHSWAVRARKRGVTLEAIAAQLGHRSLASTMIYARFTPTIEERLAQEANG